MLGEHVIYTEYTFDLFVSYSTDPDYQLSRKIESFLESFHKLKTPPDIKLKSLSVCRDGSDFSLHAIRKQAKDKTGSNDQVKDILEQYLKQSQYLIVLCSKNAALSEYVQFEIEWFLKNRGADYVILGVTEGKNLSIERGTIFSKQIIEQNLQSKIFYDLRGFKKDSKHWLKVRDAQEELTNIAAFLNNETSGKILPLWRKDERQKLNRQRYFGIIVANVFLGLAIVAFIQRREAIKQKEMAQNQLFNNYRNSTLGSIEKNNFLDAINFASEGININSKENTRDNLFQIIEEFLPQTFLKDIFYINYHVETPLLYDIDDKKIFLVKDSSLKILNPADGKESDLIRTPYEIEKVIVSPNRKQILTLGNENQTLQIWDRKSLKSIAIINNKILNNKFSIGFDQIFYSPDSKRIITISKNFTDIWDVNSGKRVDSFSPIQYAKFSKDGKSILTINKKDVEIRDAISFMPYSKSALPLDLNVKIETIVISPDLKHILILYKDLNSDLWNSKAQLYSIESGKIVGSFENIKKGIFSLNGSKVLIIAEDGTVYINNSINGKQTAIIKNTYESNTHYEYVADFSPDGRKLLTANNTVARVWDINTGELLSELPHKDVIDHAIFSPDGKKILTVDRTDTGREWYNLPEEKSVIDPRLSNQEVKPFFSKDGRLLLLQSKNNIAHIIEIKTGKQIDSISNFNYNYEQVEFSMDSKKIVGSNKRTVFLCNVDNIHKIDSFTNDNNFIRGFVLSPDGKFLITYGVKTFWIWNISTRKLIKKLDHNDAPLEHINNIKITYDNKTIISNSKNFVRIWDTKSFIQLDSIKFTDFLYDIFIIPNENSFVSISPHKIRFWDIETWKCKDSLQFNGEIFSVSFSQNGDRFFLKNYNSIQIWDRQKLSLLSSLKILGISSADISGNGKWIVTYYEEGIARIFDSNNFKPIGRPFTQLVDFKFSPKENQVLTIGIDSKILMKNIGSDVDIPPSLFRLQAIISTGVIFNQITNEINNISAKEWYKLREEYLSKAKDHYKVCQYQQFNFWARFNPNEAKELHSEISSKSNK